MTAEINTASSKKPTNILWPLFIILLGFIFLLNNFDIIPWSIWNQLSRFWPVLMIFTGLEMLIGQSRFSSLLLTILGFVVFGFIFLICLPNPESMFFYLTEIWTKIYPR
jgi:uncharacterized membrane protein YadS